MIVEKLVGLLGSAKGDWSRARIDGYYREEEWRVKRGCAAELAKMRTFRKAIDELKREAAEAISAAPWARDVIVEVLKQRLQALKAAASTEPAARRDGATAEA